MGNRITTPHDLPGLTGLVLGGGSSTRMGQDKSSFNYHGRPHRQYAFDMLSCFCNKTFYSVKTLDHKLHLPQIEDTYDFGGPLNGIVSAMSRLPGFALITVPVDMPNVNLKVISWLIDQRNLKSFATTYKGQGQIEPLLTIWEPHSYKIIVDSVKGGNFSPKNILENNNVNYVELKKSILNINTPEQKDDYISRIRDGRIPRSLRQ